MSDGSNQCTSMGSVEKDEKITSEEYVVQRIRDALKTNVLQAKTWIVTAKSLYPHNFTIHFEAYKIEKNESNAEEAAKWFDALIRKFQEVPECWEELNKVISALKDDNDSSNPENQFLREMFPHISLDGQHKLLLLTAQRFDDPLEHCKILLLLLQRFPSAIPTHGPGLIKTLLKAEKRSTSVNDPTNDFRKLLACDLFPLVNTQNDNFLILKPKLLCKLFLKSIEYHLCLLKDDAFHQGELPNGFISEDSWNKLFIALEYIGKQLGWEHDLINFTNNWCIESYWQKLLSYCQLRDLSIVNEFIIKQLVYCITIFLLFCLYQYIKRSNMENVIGQTHPSYLLVEAFVDPNLPNLPVEDPKVKRIRRDVDFLEPIITTEKSTMQSMTSHFLMAVKCWEILHSSENLIREFMRLSSILDLEPWLRGFLVDYLIYNGKNEEALRRLDNDSNQVPLIKNLLKASIYYLQSNYMVCYDFIIDVLKMLPTNVGVISTQLTIGGNQRHLHFLSLTRFGILQYCSKLLFKAIRNNGLKCDMSVGHCFVLMQLDWPQEEDALPELIQEINRTGLFYYLPFQKYIFQMGILEQIDCLINNQYEQVRVEILPYVQIQQDRTRGTVKEVRESSKKLIRRQITRYHVAFDELILNFIIQEKPRIVHSLINDRKKQNNKKLFNKKLFK